MTKARAALGQIDAFVKDWLREQNIPGLAIAITSRAAPVEILVYGHADAAGRTPVTSETLFEIGSLGKPFTSIALLQLRDAGVLDLHRPVAEYLPWFRVRSKHAPIATHHLMNHTAGIIRGTEQAAHGLYDCWALRETEVSAAPGEYFSYSSLGYKVLGFLLEELSGQSYAEAIASRILQPLGMSQTHAVTTLATRERSAIGYAGFYDDRPEHPSHPIVPAPWQESGTGDGCQASTPDDMGRYARALLNYGQGPTQSIMSRESFDMMTLNGIWTGGDYYGYGLATYEDEGKTYVGHGGGNAGFRSAMVLDLEEGLGVVLLLNRMGETDPVVAVAQHLLTLLRSANRGEPSAAWPEFRAASPVSDAGAYAGTYRSGSRELQLVARGGRLVLVAEEGQVTLEPRGLDRFFIPHPDYALFLLEFAREGDQIVEAFHGPDWYTNNNYTGPTDFEVPRQWAAFVGHYRTRNPELSNFRVVVRKAVLTLIIAWGDSQPLHALTADTFRIGDDPLGPEKLRFDAIEAGGALCAYYSGCPYFRAFTP